MSGAEGVMTTAAACFVADRDFYVPLGAARGYWQPVTLGGRTVGGLVG